MKSIAEPIAVHTHLARRKKWPQRLAVTAVVAITAAGFSYSQSDLAFARRLEESGGTVMFGGTSPDWISHWLGEPVALWFDTPIGVTCSKRVPDDVVRRIAEIETLRWIGLEHWNLTDESFAAFKGHPSLKEVRLTNTLVTDDVFESLETLPQLRLAMLSWTEVSPGGLSDFRERHPDVAVDVDPLTALGLGRYAADGRVKVRPDWERFPHLTISGPIDDTLVTALKDLPLDTLWLDGVKEEGKLVSLLQGGQLRSFHMSGGTLEADAAAALTATGVRDVSLGSMRLSAAAAAALSRASLHNVSLNAVDLDTAALATLLEDWDLSSFEQMALNVGCPLDADTVSSLVTGAAMLQQGAVVKLDAGTLAALRNLVTFPEDPYATMIRPRSEVDWPEFFPGRTLSLSNMHILADDASALAKCPLESLDLTNIAWGEGAISNLKKFQAKRLDLYDTSGLPRELSAALADGQMVELSIRTGPDGSLLNEIAKMSRLQSLSIQVSEATGDQLTEIASLPNLRSFHVIYQPSIDLPEDFWQKLAKRYPSMEIQAYIEERLGAESRMYYSMRHVWPVR